MVGRALSGAWLVLSAIVLALPAAAQDIVGWRVGHQVDGTTRLVLDLTAEVQPRLFTLAEPYRLVLDFDRTTWRLNDPATPVGGLVAGVRSGQLQPGTTRVVIDLAGPSRLARGFVLDPRQGFGWRLVLDLAATDRDSFIAGSQQRLALSTPSGETPASGGAPRLGLVSPLLNPPPPGDPRLGQYMLARPAIAPDRPVAPPPLVSQQPEPAVPRRPAPVQAAPTRMSLLPSLTSPAQAAPPAPPAAALRPGAPAQPVVVPIQPPVPAPPAKRAPGRRVVAIDAGHGGIDPGAVSLGGGFEKHITLEVAREIRRQLEASGRYRVVMTRDRDEFVRLRDRVSIARAAGADLFLSIHADAIGNSAVGGLSIYTLSETASDRETEALATKENKSDLIAGMDLGSETREVTNILIDLAQRETKNFSAAFAGRLVQELGRETRLLSKPHRFAGFAVLTAPDVPSVLVELGYLSNRSDERELRDPAHRAKLARGILRAVDRHFSEKAPARRS